LRCPPRVAAYPRLREAVLVTRTNGCIREWNHFEGTRRRTVLGDPPCSRQNHDCDLWNT
jgi:hypothetical protein